jgi:hypothetical protein
MDYWWQNARRGRSRPVYGVYGFKRIANRLRRRRVRIARLAVNRVARESFSLTRDQANAAARWK